MESSTKPAWQKRLLLVVPYLIVFLCTLSAGILMYHAVGISPFGNRSILALDQFFQYFPMYVQNAHPTGFSDAFYSWQGSLGFNNWSQNAYYCLSVFFALFGLVPESGMVTLACWIAILKPAFASMTMLGFLRYRCGKYAPLLLGGGVAYGLSAYIMAFFAQAMWTDCVIYTPLVLVGLERLLEGKRQLLYTLMLALTIISNFYIGFAVCLFLVLYLLTRTLPMIWQKDGEGFHGVLNRWIRFAIFSLLAGGIAAAVILPVGMTIGQTIASELGAPEKLEWYKNYFEVLAQGLPQAKLVYAYDYANWASGILLFLTVPLFFLNKSIRRSDRIAGGVLLAFLLLSLNCNYLDYLWHGLHFPNQLPGRWCFLLSLYLILLGTLGASKPEGLSALRTGIGEAIGVLLILLICIAPGSDQTINLPVLYWVMLIAAGAGLIGAVVLAHAKGDDKRRKLMQDLSLACMAAVMAMQVADCMVNFVHVSCYESDKGGIKTTAVSSMKDRMASLREEVAPYRPAANTFYRVADYPWHTFNPGMAGGYPSMSVYSSTMQGETFRLLKELGNWPYARNVSSLYNAGSAVQNSLFGVRYILSKTGDAYSGTEQIAAEDSLMIYENKTALSLAYAVSDDFAKLPLTDEIHPIRNQAAFLDAMIGENSYVFIPMGETLASHENCTLDDTDNWELRYFHRDESANSVRFHYEFTCTQDGEVILENNFRAGKLQIAWDGGSREVDSPKVRFLCLGNLPAGTKITVDTEIENVRLGCYGVNLYRFDAVRWQELYERLAAHQMEITSFAPTRIDGTIRLDSESLVLATITQDGGWRVYCDGKRIPSGTASGTLLTAKIPAGEHTISYRYHVPGLLAGGIITAISLLLTVLLSVPELTAKLLKKEKPETGNPVSA
ncbi:MAG: YfhO family protein [Oscillospiraceae bacterium]|nr:YfhO family protein [Oscillospiraceae bacterium]